MEVAVAEKRPHFGVLRSQPVAHFKGVAFLGQHIVLTQSTDGGEKASRRSEIVHVVAGPRRIAGTEQRLVTGRAEDVDASTACTGQLHGRVAQPKVADPRLAGVADKVVERRT